MNDDQGPARRDVERLEAGTEEISASPEEERGGRHRAADGGEERQGSFLRELPVLIIVAFVLALIIKAFVVQAFYIPSGSMENTLRIQDRVLVNKLAYDIHGVHRGDIVVFDSAGSWDPAAPEAPNPATRALWAVEGVFGVTPPGEKYIIKRVIGLPGDRVACCDARGRVTVDGVPLKERAYLYPGNPPSQTSFHARVPPGHLWVMGDHRSVSADSRSHPGDPGGGAVPIDEVAGRAFVIIWPPSHVRLLSAPATFEQSALQRATTAAPDFLGLAGALPVVLVRRRRRRRARRS